MRRVIPVLLLVLALFPPLHGRAQVMPAQGSGTWPPRILSRLEWGADDSLLLRGREEGEFGTNGSAGVSQALQISDGTTPENRVRECEEMIRLHPEEFRAERKVTRSAEGGLLRWPREYSTRIRLLVLHHTGQLTGTERRSGIERMRALYQFHAQSRGWGDIGYHYVIDERGQIYEGRSGGGKVVGGHAYCHNIGTLGIALMGNFDVEKPTAEQARSLQWLLHLLAKEHGVDPDGRVSFHGRMLPAISGHQDLLSTSCPGDTFEQALPQIRRNVARGLLDGEVDFPDPRPDLRRPGGSGTIAPIVPPAEGESTSATARVPGLSAAGGTALQGRPGEEQLFSMQYHAAEKRVAERSPIATISRSDEKISLFQDIGGQFERLRGALLVPQALAPHSSVTLRLKVQFPLTVGSSSFTIGGIRYALEASGRRMRSPQQQASHQVYRAPAAAYSRTKRLERARMPSAPPASRAPREAQATVPPLIRIRLSHPPSASIIVDAGTRPRVNGRESRGGRVTLRRAGSTCSAETGDGEFSANILRITPSEEATTLLSWETRRNQFRGVLECRIFDGAMILINELSLEEYLWGLSEEDDAQPFEKQRAIAIAARSYALHYLDPAHRKFPGKPYDGSDDPAEFQAYGGLAFEEKNPEWVRAVRDTQGKVLTVDGDVLKAPYFSSSDGRTRSPSEMVEAFWKIFPHSEVFTSKPDPWCRGMALRGHGVGMSGCGALGQAREGRSAEEILTYYYPGTEIVRR